MTKATKENTIEAPAKKAIRAVKIAEFQTEIAVLSKSSGGSKKAYVEKHMALGKSKAEAKNAFDKLIKERDKLAIAKAITENVKKHHMTVTTYSQSYCVRGRMIG